MRFGYARHPRIVSTEKARTWLLLSQPVSGILDAVGSKDSTRMIPPQLQNVSIQDALAAREAFILGYGRRGALRRFAFSWSEPVPGCALRRSAIALRRLARAFLQMSFALFRAISAFFQTAKASRRSSVVEPGRAQTLRQLAFALITVDSSFSFFIGIRIAAPQPKICRTLHTFTTYGT